MRQDAESLDCLYGVPLFPDAHSISQGTLKFDKKYLNEEFSDFLSIVKLFIKESNCAQPPKAACLACAGPILDNTVNFTNIATGWLIDGNELAADIGIPKVGSSFVLNVQ